MWKYLFPPSAPPQPQSHNQTQSSVLVALWAKQLRVGLYTYMGRHTVTPHFRSIHTTFNLKYLAHNHKSWNKWGNLLFQSSSTCLHLHIVYEMKGTNNKCKYLFSLNQFFSSLQFTSILPHLLTSPLIRFLIRKADNRNLLLRTVIRAKLANICKELKTVSGTK